MTPNFEVFQYQVRGENKYADPMKLRRVLLEKTHGRCWTILHNIKHLQGEIERNFKMAEAIQQNIHENPQTVEEIALVEKKTKEYADTKKWGNYEELPRALKVEVISTIAAVKNKELANQEGMLIEAARQAFNLPPIDEKTGEGYTEEECWPIIRSFVDYSTKKSGPLGS